MTIGEHPINSTHYTTSTQLRTVKGTRKYYFKTIGYCFRTNVDSPLMLRRFQATYPQGCGRFVRGVLHRALSALGQYQDLNQLYHSKIFYCSVHFTFSWLGEPFWVLINVFSRFVCSFWRIHGNFPRQLHLGEISYTQKVASPLATAIRPWVKNGYSVTAPIDKVTSDFLKPEEAWLVLASQNIATTVYSLCLISPRSCLVVLD